MCRSESRRERWEGDLTFLFSLPLSTLPWSGGSHCLCMQSAAAASNEDEGPGRKGRRWRKDSATFFSHKNFFSAKATLPSRRQLQKCVYMYKIKGWFVECLLFLRNTSSTIFEVAAFHSFSHLPGERKETEKRFSVEFTICPPPPPLSTSAPSPLSTHFSATGKFSGISNNCCEHPLALVAGTK